MALPRTPLALALFVLAVSAGSASAATTHDVRGTWDLTCGGACGAQTHTFKTQDAAGKVTGTGKGGGTTWTINGTVTGDQVQFRIVYSGGGYTADMTGTLNAATTQITGTFDDNAGHNNLAFTMRRLTSAAPPDDQPLPPVSGPPPPQVGRNANLATQSGTVLVKVAGSNSFVPLTDPQQIQMGAIIDARKGRVRISIDNGKGGVDTADFYEGIFRLTQRATGNRVGTLTLVGGSFKGCPRAPKAQLSKKNPARSVRHLWGSGRGSFRTVGRFSSATLRGTTWLTDDKCNGTLTRVIRGAVTVRDFARRKNVVVKAPGRYLAQRR